jgi:lipid II:glycine glycyltransferase (peptidoglycan interpeptide bridge formation enzyme)
MNVEWNFSSQSQWSQFHSDHRGALQQSWAYGEALMSLGIRIERAAFWNEGQLIGIAQFMCRRFLAYVSLASCTRGPVWDPQVTPEQRSQFYKMLKRSLPVAPLRVMLVSPDVSAEQLDTRELQGFSRVMTGYSTAYLNLGLSEDTLKSNLDGKWRNRLNKVLSHEKLRVHAQPSLKRCAWLLAKEDDQREARKFHGLPTHFVPAYIEKCESPQQAFVVVYAELGKESVAGMLFLIHGQVASYHMGWASEEGRALNAHNALLWKAVMYLKAQGIKLLDLGGVNTHDLPGISRFKLGTGGSVVTLAGTYF